MADSNERGEVMITLSDFIHPIRRSKKKIVMTAMIFALLGSLFSLSREPKYFVEASFRERAPAKEEIGTSQIKQMILSGDNKSSQNVAASTMSSKNLLSRVTKRLNLQAKLKKKETTYLLFNRIRNNLKLEWAYLTKNPFPVVRRDQLPVVLQHVQYSLETPAYWEVTFSDESSYVVNDKEGAFIGTGTIGKLFEWNGISFVIEQAGPALLQDTVYALTLVPSKAVADDLFKKLVIRTDPKDSTLINIKYKDDDRDLAAKIVNGLMEVYQQYLREENYRTSQEQIAYLENREESIGENLKGMMHQYAVSISSDINQSGYPNSTMAMEFLFKEQSELKMKLAAVDLEIARVETAIKEGYAYYERHHPLDVTTIYPELIRNIRELKKEADCLDLALHSPLTRENFALGQLFVIQYAELENIRQTVQEARDLLAALEKESDDLPTLYHLDTSRYMVNTWLEKLDISHKRKQNPPSEETYYMEQEYQSTRANFAAYLKKLVHLLAVNEQVVRERLANQQSPATDPQGVSLPLARKMGQDYHAEFNGIETAISKHTFLLEQIRSSDFEISSLSGVLTDPVCMEIISRAGVLALEINDQRNKMAKEQTRLKNELKLQKEFLSLHLEQTIQLEKIQLNLLKSKIDSLQSTILHLIQQEVSLLEKNLKDYFEIRLSSLIEEKKNILQYISDINEEFCLLPEKWIQEKLIDHHLSMGQKMVEQVSQLVETKNLTSNLEVIQSAPLDTAHSPVHPNQPHLILFTIGGMLLGGCLGVSHSIIQSVLRGPSFSESALRLTGVHVSGRLDPDNEGGNFAVYRRVISYFGVNKEKVVFLVTGKGPDYGDKLAFLYSKSGEKVLVLPISFETPPEDKEEVGILQCLEGIGEMPAIHVENGIYHANGGGVSQYGSELVNGIRFQRLVEKLSQEYDRIIAVSHALPGSAEAENLIAKNQQVIVTISDETSDELMPLISLGRNERKRITFLLWG